MQALYFVRHGESEDNSRTVWSRPWTPLTDKGRQQARDSAKAIKEQGLAFDLIVVSPLSRAQETAQIIIDAIGHPRDALETNDLFVERDWGSLAGTEGYGTLTIADIDNVPGAEKLEHVQERARQGLEYLKSKPHARILLVGHGSYGRALRRVINGEPHTNEYLPNLVRFANGEVARLI